MAAQSQSTEKPSLTFGVEIEFALPTLDDKTLDPHPEDRRNVHGIDGGITNKADGVRNVQSYLAHTLTQAGIPAEAAGSGHRELKKPVQADAWLIKQDSSILCPDETYRWYGIEMISPPYFFEENSVMLVGKMCAILAKNFRINCNESCGLHVHVGNGDKGFLDDVLRNLMSTIWTFEPHLNLIHPEFRTEGAHYDTYCPSMDRTALGVEQMIRQSYNPRRPGLEILLTTAGKPNKIQELMGFPDDISTRGAYNLNWLDSRRFMLYANEPKPKTVEFRQHETTLNSDRVMNWVQLCVRLLEFADTVERERVDNFLKAHVDEGPQNFSLTRVLCALGMPAQGRYYGLRIGRQNGRQKNERAGKEKLYETFDCL
jgi:hypothetical protein